MKRVRSLIVAILGVILGVYAATYAYRSVSGFLESFREVAKFERMADSCVEAAYLEGHAITDYEAGVASTATTIFCKEARDYLLAMKKESQQLLQVEDLVVLELIQPGTIEGLTPEQIEDIKLRFQELKPKLLERKSMNNKKTQWT